MGDDKPSNSGKVLFDSETRQPRQSSLADARNADVTFGRERASNRRSGYGVRDTSASAYDRSGSPAADDSHDNAKNRIQAEFNREISEAGQNWAEMQSINADVSGAANAGNNISGDTQNLNTTAETNIPADADAQSGSAKRRTSGSAEKPDEYVSSFLSDSTEPEKPAAKSGKDKPHSEDIEPWGSKNSGRRKSKAKERPSKLQGNPDAKASEYKTALTHERPGRLDFGGKGERMSTEPRHSEAVSSRSDKQKQISRVAEALKANHGAPSAPEPTDTVTPVRDSTADRAGVSYAEARGLSVAADAGTGTRPESAVGSTNPADTSFAEADGTDSKSKHTSPLSPLSESRETGTASHDTVNGGKFSTAKNTNVQLDKPSKLQFGDGSALFDKGHDKAAINAQRKRNMSQKGIQQTGDATNPVKSNEHHIPGTADRDRRSAGDSLRGSSDNGGQSTRTAPQSASADISPLQAAADKKAAKARLKADRSAEKLEKAENKLPKKHRLKLDKTIDPESNKPKRKLHFEAEAKSQGDHIKGAAPTRPVKFGMNAAIAYGHKKIYMAERENVGTEAAHKGELLAEGALRTAYRRHKTKPYRRVENLSRKTAKLNARASYRKAIADNPRLQKSLTRRMIQKHKINRQYAQAARDAKRSGGLIKRTADMVGRASNFLVRAVMKNPKVIAILGAIILMFIIISSLVTACSNMASGVGQVVVATSYVAESAAIDDAAIAYTEWETELEERLANIRTEFPGFDEYRISGASINHNPFELMAFLTAMHQDFTYPEIREFLREIFDEQYQLTITPSVEIRHYLNDEGELIPYEWHVLTVNLTARSFSEVIQSRMNANQQQHFDLLMQSGGNRQYVGSPFPFNWMPFVSSHYGWRIHPISGSPEFHTGVDIALPGGTEILAAHSGVVTFAGVSGGYGNFVIIEGSNGITTRYAHCAAILVTVGQEVSQGDVIATVGSTGNSTGPHLHFEIIRDGRFLNPAFFSLTGRSVGESANRPNFGFPGIALDDEQFTALITEAERHLGLRYVWGGSTPAQGFDCSGFVSYVLRTAGIRDVGRTTAQGLYNISTPVPPSEARPGDLVFFQGTFSSYRTVTHVGIYVGNGYMIHTGSNPAGVEYTNINTPFWQRHFFAFGRV
ncbi:MAG: peptidoglycan DD-metalloendopeptidase family protein [Defluviitaleaceae bacterium]|nr:peptidoglycan DD-metalloendopeptidase family protein [Defluviitaleaceae bacterium]